VVFSQAIYKLRQQKAELPFGHMKRNLKVDAFLLRGRDGVKAEALLLASCFNIRGMMSIIGIRALIEKFKKLASLREGPFYCIDGTLHSRYLRRVRKQHLSKTRN